jgi:CHASE1-domain containing sensor protein
MTPSTSTSSPPARAQPDPPAVPLRIRRVRWRRHRYPERIIGSRQELWIALVFGAIGLLITTALFLNAESLVCALGDWTLEGCAQRLPPPDE